MTPTSVHIVAAARPNFMKVAPLFHALASEEWCRPSIVHTGQHYDANMSDAFFRDLRLPAPHFHLGVGSGTHAEQMGGVMMAYEEVAVSERPDWIVVVGDVNSTAACAIVGTKLWIPVVHLEAGLRSGDRSMPEEINRLVTDAIRDVLWTPSPDADENLMRESVPASKIDRVGNIMLDSFEMMRPAIEADGTRDEMGLAPGDYVVVTLHRPSNVDQRRACRQRPDRAGRPRRLWLCGEGEERAGREQCRGRCAGTGGHGPDDHHPVGRDLAGRRQCVEDPAPNSLAHGLGRIRANRGVRDGPFRRRFARPREDVRTEPIPERIIGIAL
jgi:hypothetical protein